MKMRLMLSVVALAILPHLVRGADELPAMKFNEVREVAPAVFFRYASISATDKNIPFGGCNVTWIVFQDYVTVIDATFPKEAGDVIADIKKTTDKPIRYVLDTHHHGDHAYGNAVFGKAGASIVAQTQCARLLRVNGPAEFKSAGRGPTGRKDIAESSLRVPNLVFDDKLVLDDGTQRIEFYFLGHAHTAGDAFAYLPKHKLLCTGDACVNGAFNYMGHSDSASWVRVLERAQQFDVQTICPGHGPLAGKELLEKQKRYFIELRAYVRKGIDARQPLAEIAENIDFPWYKEWTGTKPSPENVKHVYDEFTGRVPPLDLFEDFGVYEGPSPTKTTAGWTPPRRIVVPNLMPAQLADLKIAAPDIEFIPVKTAEDAAKVVEDADAVLGFCSADIVKAGPKLRWIQVRHAGVEKDLVPELVNSKIVVTNTQRIYGPQVADQAFALLLCLTRGLREVLPAEVNDMVWNKPTGNQEELHGKTMLLVGCGGVGQQIARRAQAFGMRVMAVDPKQMPRPDYVFSLDKPAKLPELLPVADVIVLACPLTNETRGSIGAAQFKAMKKSAYLINIARGGVVDTDALVDALDNKLIAGAGLDVLDPEPLPKGHALWKHANVVISPHLGGQSTGGQERQWKLWRENIRRFVAGEPLLCVVDKERGY